MIDIRQYSSNFHFIIKRQLIIHQNKLHIGYNVNDKKLICNDLNKSIVFMPDTPNHS